MTAAEKDGPVGFAAYVSPLVAADDFDSATGGPRPECFDARGNYRPAADRGASDA